MAANPDYEQAVQSNNIRNRAIPEDLVSPENLGSTDEEKNYGTGDAEADKRAVQLKLSRTRVNADRVEQFVDNRNATWLVNLGKGPRQGSVPTPEQLEEMIASGIDTQGIFTVIEPADLDLYRSLLPAPLKMPAHPLVGATLLDMNPGNPTDRFQEGRLSIKCLCPDGLESWLVISTPVPFNIQCRNGVIWGWPKYVADQISFSREENSAKAEVLY